MSKRVRLKKIKSLEFYEPIAEKAVNFSAFGIDLKPALKHFLPPKEDFILRSKHLPIFAVSDGVTLEPGVAGYPNPSGAEAVARIFCGACVKAAEKSYSKTDPPNLPLIFQSANRAVKKYNDAQVRMWGKPNYWDRDLFAATASAAVIFDNRLYWLSINDAFIVLYDKNGKKKFQSPDRWRGIKNFPRGWNSKSLVERKKILRRVYRNGIGKNGQLIGYGVVTGEPAAEKYLNAGSLPLRAGDFVLLGTDGFTPYLADPKFLKLFRDSRKGLDSRLRRFTAKKCEEDASSFGHERSLIAVWI